MEMLSTNFLNFVGQTIQTLIILVGGIMALGAAKQEMRQQSAQLVKMDIRIDKLEAAFVQLARQDERLNSMDQRMLSQGRRLDRYEYARRKAKETEDEDS